MNDYSVVPDVASNKPTSHVLQILMADTNLNESCGQNGRMFPVVDDVLFPNRAERYTSVYDLKRHKSESNRYYGKFSQIDHILVTQQIKNHIERVWIDHSHDPFSVSDHWPLFIQISWDSQHSNISAIHNPANNIMAQENKLRLPNSMFSGFSKEESFNPAIIIVIVATALIMVIVIATIVISRWLRLKRNYNNSTSSLQMESPNIKFKRVNEDDSYLFSETHIADDAE